MAAPAPGILETGSRVAGRALCHSQLLLGTRGAFPSAVIAAVSSYVLAGVILLLAEELISGEPEIHSFRCIILHMGIYRIGIEEGQFVVLWRARGVPPAALHLFTSHSILSNCDHNVPRFNL